MWGGGGLVISVILKFLISLKYSKLISLFFLYCLMYVDPI